MCIANSARSLVAVGLFLLVAGALGAAGGPAAPAEPPAAETTTSAGVSAGLCVQIGGDDTTLAAELAKTGRFLVHVLADDEATVAAARDRLARQAQYGMVSVERWDAKERLPYTENLDNLLVTRTRPAAGVSPKELKRVLCPNGVVLAAPGTMTAVQLREAGLQQIENRPAGREWLAAKKPRPAEMDEG